MCGYVVCSVASSERQSGGLKLLLTAVDNRGWFKRVAPDACECVFPCRICGACVSDHLTDLPISLSLSLTLSLTLSYSLAHSLAHSLSRSLFHALTLTLSLCLSLSQ